MEVKGSEAQGRHREVGAEGSVEQRRGPMNKNRMRRPTAAGERARYREAHIHQGGWWQIRRLCVEGGRTYLGRSATCHGIVTESEAIHFDRAKRDEFHPATTQAEGERGEECGGATAGAEVSGLQLYRWSGSETADCAESPAPLSPKSAGTDAPIARHQCGADDEGPGQLLTCLEQLLRLLPDAFGAGTAGSMDSASVAIRDLEADETTQFVASGP